MKKVTKSNSFWGQQEITYTIDENLDKLKGRVLAPKKLAEANRLLKNLKSPLPGATGK